MQSVVCVSPQLRCSNQALYGWVSLNAGREEAPDTEITREIHRTKAVIQ